jgi:hypothetical protein
VVASTTTASSWPRLQPWKTRAAMVTAPTSTTRKAERPRARRRTTVEA